MGTTSNYSWPYPEATGLVKDGWEDIKDLATAIDTTAASTFTGGLIKINSTTFSAVSSQSFNNVFSSTYLHYLLVATIISTNDTDVNFRWRVSGSDNSTSNYSWASAGIFATGSTLSYGVSNNAAQFRLLGSNAANSQKFGTFTLYNPFATDTSGITGTLAFSSGTANYFGGSLGGGFNGTTSFDGFTIYPAAGTISGTVKVYGIKN